MHSLYLKDKKGQDARIAITPVLYESDVRMSSPEGEIERRTYLQATERCLFGPLSEEFGEDLGQKLIEADPEADIERVGYSVNGTDVVYLTSSGEVLYVAPRVEEVLFNPEEEEVNRREPKDHEANTQDEVPVAPFKGKGKKYPKLEFLRSFVVARTLQCHHVDGLTYTWLHDWAKELADEGVVETLAAGPEMQDWLRFQRNGSKYRAFLEGRVDTGGKYKLLMHLSNMPVKRDAGPFSNEFTD